MAYERANPGKKLEFFEVGVCETAFEIGFLIGRRFSDLIRNRIASDLIFQEQLLPFARTDQAKPLLDELCNNNKQKFPRYWDELVGTFVPKSGRAATKEEEEESSNDCSDVLIVNDSMAIDVCSYWKCSYLLRVMMSNGLSFTAFTYAGELPSCAFGFNSNGIV